MKELKQYLNEQDARGLNELVHSSKFRDARDLFFENGQAQHIDESNVLAFFHLLGEDYKNNGVGTLDMHVSAEYKEPGFFYRNEDGAEQAFIPITNINQKRLYHCLSKGKRSVFQ
tara:strand:- start:722 stop:1066 length:345 start_codon:yes stop_codon:yes gene_type:complete